MVELFLGTSPSENLNAVTITKPLFRFAVDKCKTGYDAELQIAIADIETARITQRSRKAYTSRMGSETKLELRRVTRFLLCHLLRNLFFEMIRQRENSVRCSRIGGRQNVHNYLGYEKFEVSCKPKTFCFKRESKENLVSRRFGRFPPPTATLPKRAERRLALPSNPLFEALSGFAASSSAYPLAVARSQLHHHYMRCI